MKNAKSTILWVVLAITAVALTNVASADSFEPDNDYSNAASITTDGQAQSHSIDPAADEDWLIFTIANHSDVVIETSGISGDTVMWLYDAQLGELSYDDDSGTGSFSRIQISLPAGTYYVRIREYNNKAIISEYFVSVLAIPVEVLSIDPNSATQGDSLNVTINGQGTTFFEGSSTVTNVWLSKGSTTIDANSFTGIDATTLEASFDIPANALAGKWNVHVSNSVDGNLPSFADGFLIYSYPDLNGDGKVDAIDFALLAKHWLEVAVPNVIGMTQTEAEDTIVSAFLLVGAINQVNNNSIPSGNVISSEPVACTKVNAGSAVNLLISIGPFPVVPNVTNMKKADAEAAITAAGLLVGTLTEEYSGTVAYDSVISQNPPAGEEVLEGSIVNLIISQGPEGQPNMVWVSINDPDFNGQMSKYETTNAQYCQFLNAAKASGDITVSNGIVYGANGSNSGADFVGQPYYNLTGIGYTCCGGFFTNAGAARITYGGHFGFGLGNHPVTYVSWYGAAAFCNYYGYRLPSELEWQAVADYDGSFIYGCGTTINSSMANYGSNQNPPYGVTEVGTHGTYGYGLADMAGNLWELTSTVSSGSEYRIKGGSWDNEVVYCTVSVGTHYNQSGSTFNLGFRVCR